MNGIQGLMQAPGQGQPPQAPGQAAPPGQGQPPMPGMQPGAGGPQGGVQSLTPALAQMNKQQLLMEMMNPNSQIPKFALLSAIDQKVKQEKAMQAVQGSMAQGQNAQNQQQGSVAQGILQEAMQGAQQPPTQITRHGGVMHGYAGGGIVAFQAGGMTDAQKAELMALGIASSTIDEAIKQGMTYEDIKNRSFRRAEAQPVTAVISSPEEQVAPQEVPLEQRQARAAAIKENVFLPTPLSKLAFGDKPDFYKQQLTEPPPPHIPSFPGKSEDPDVAVGAKQIPERLKDTRTRPDLGAGVVKTRTPSVTPPLTAQAPTEPVKTDQALENYLSELRTRRGPPEDVLSGRAGIESLVREEMEARKARLAQDRAAAEQRQREAIERAPGVFSPEGLLAIAASIDPRRGYELGSAAKGAFGVMAGQRKAQEEARKEFREFERAERTEQNLLSQMRTLEAQRQQAIREKDVDSANAITDKLYTVQQDYQKFREDLRLKQEKMEIDRLTAEAAKAEGEAKTKTAQASLESLSDARKQAAISNAQLRVTTLIDKRKEVPVGILGPMAGIFFSDEKKFAETNPDKYQEVKKALASYDKNIAEARARLEDLLNQADNLPFGVRVKRTGP